MKKVAVLSFLFAIMLALSGCTLFSCNDGKIVTHTEPLSLTTGASPTEIVEEYIDATITIFVFDASGDSVSLGSGVAVHSGGYIATNYHVISAVVNNSSYYLKVYLNNGEQGYDADVLWYNANLDVAIIRSEYYNIPFVEMEDRWISTSNPLRVLEQVVAIGTPIDYSLQNTASIGYISSTQKRYSTSDSRIYEDLIQHTAPISNGNSGGPLFDMNGKLIALNTLGMKDKDGTNGYQANSLYFSVPIYPIIKVIDRVVATGFQTPVLEIQGYDELESDLRSINNLNEDGFYVSAVTVNGVSYGKLKVGDIIKKVTVGVTEYTITDRNDLIYALISANSGDTIKVEYKRILINKEVEITLA